VVEADDGLTEQNRTCDNVVLREITFWCLVLTRGEMRETRAEPWR